MKILSADYKKNSACAVPLRVSAGAVCAIYTIERIQLILDLAKQWANVISKSI